MNTIDTITKKHNVIFAFTKESFLEQYNKDYKYKSIGYGGYIPKQNYNAFCLDCDSLHNNKIKTAKTTKTDYKIAFDIFMNYELQYSNIESEHIKELSEYGISEANVYKYYDRFIDFCSNNDLI